MSPVASWTPSERWLFEALARDALVVQQGDASPERIVAFGGERLLLPLPDGPVKVTLAPRHALGHPWRERWGLELERAGARAFLAQPGDEVQLSGDGSAFVRMLSRGEIADAEPVEGAAPVPLLDAALGKHTRQSTAAAPGERELAPFMTPTEREAQPWWEVDLGATMYVATVSLWPAARPPAGGTLRIYAYAYGTPKAEPPSACWQQALPLAGNEARVRFELGTVARYLRVELTAPAAEAAPLALAGFEAMAAELYAETLLATYQRAFTLFRERPLFSRRAAPGAGGYERWSSYGEVWDEACRLAAGLARLLPAERVFLAICCENRREWVTADLAAIQRGWVVVPLAPDDSHERLRELIERCQARCLVCEPRHVAALAGCSSLELLVVCDGDGDGATRAKPSARSVVGERSSPRLGTPGSSVQSYDEVLDARVVAATPAGDDDLYTLLFTSGSTGKPKGAMRSSGAFHRMLRSYGVVEPAVHLSFQPLSHLSERMQLPTLVIQGGQAGFSSGAAHLLSDLRALEPTFVFSVPRLYEVLHASYQRKLRREQQARPALDAAAVEAEVLAETRGAFGGRLQSVAVGSAPCSPEVFAFLRRCFHDIWVTEGYGSTECGTIAVDGRIQADVEVRLVAVPALGYSPDGDPPRGEIWVKSKNRISGYFGDDGPAGFDDEGFFHTGDLGERGADGSVRVIGRIKSAVKLAQGEFVVPDRIETLLASAPLVDRVFVHADSRTGVRALVVPQREALARAIGQDAPLAELCVEPRAAGVVHRELALHGRQAGLAGYELPGAVLLSAEPMTVANGLLSASGKLRREQAIERFAAALGALTPAAAADDGPLVARVAAEVLGRAVDIDQPLAGVAVDSLSAAEVMSALAEQLGRPVPLGLWFEARTLRDLAERLDRAPAAHVPGLAEEDLALTPLRGPGVPARHPPRALLLTGVTGFLGAHLLEAFARRPELELRCLVRAGSQAAAEARLAQALERWGIAAARVTVIAGDLAEPRLGLDEARWRGLASELDAVVHAGAVVSWLARYDQLRAPNVLGTLALLELAAVERDKSFHFVSTISTAPGDGDEDSLLPFAAAAAGSGYGLSKWLAETQVRRAAMPFAVYRPAMIAGHSRRGRGNPDDYVNRYLRACIESGLCLDHDARLDMTPVDFVAEAIAALALAASPAGGTYHLCNLDQSLSYAELGRALAAAGVACRPVDYEVFREALPRTALRPLASYFPAQGFALGMGPWPAARSRAALAALGVRCPPVNQRLIEGYVAALRPIPHDVARSQGSS